MIFFNQSNIPLPILKPNHFLFLLIIFYLVGDVLVTEKHSVATENTEHERNAEKSEQIFINCVENVEERHNIKVSKIAIFLCGHNTIKSKLHSQIN